MRTAPSANGGACSRKRRPRRGRDGQRYRKQVKKRRFPRPSRQLMYSSLAVLLAGVLSIWAFPRLVGAVDSFLNESARGEDR